MPAEYSGMADAGVKGSAGGQKGGTKRGHKPFPPTKARSSLMDLLADWPVTTPRKWSKLMDQPQDEKELAALRCCRQRGRPYGNADCVATTPGVWASKAHCVLPAGPKNRRIKKRAYDRFSG
jgi:hypothetical protein